LKTAICLCAVSPLRSGISPVPPGDMGRASQNPHAVLLRIGFTADLCYHRNGWALTSPFHPYRAGPGGLFLLHFPGSHLRLTLSAILPCEARTFLTAIPFGTMPRGRSAELRVYYNTNTGRCQDAWEEGAAYPAVQ